MWAALISGIISLASAGIQAGARRKASREATGKQAELESRQQKLEEERKAFSKEIGDRELIRGRKAFERQREMFDIQNKMQQEDLEKQKQKTRRSLVQGVSDTGRAKPIENLGLTQRSSLRLRGGN